MCAKLLLTFASWIVVAMVCQTYECGDWQRQCLHISATFKCADDTPLKGAWVYFWEEDSDLGDQLLKTVTTNSAGSVSVWVDAQDGYHMPMDLIDVYYTVHSTCQGMGPIWVRSKTFTPNSIGVSGLDYDTIDVENVPTAKPNESYNDKIDKNILKEQDEAGTSGIFGIRKGELRSVEPRRVEMQTIEPDTDVGTATDSDEIPGTSTDGDDDDDAVDSNYDSGSETTMDYSNFEP